MIGQSDTYDAAQERKRLWGVYTAVVTDIRDPDGQGRVRVNFPWASDANGSYELWARLATPLAGNNRGVWWIPDPNDEVLVAFEGGDPRLPCIVGSLWNGRDTPPEQMDGAGNNDKKTLRSRNGVKITLDDSSGQEKLILETPGGQKLILQDGSGAIEIRDSNGNSVKLEAAGITIQTAGKLTFQAGTLEISTATITANAGMSKFSGLVKSDTNITNSTISASYTPGAGNIW